MRYTTFERRTGLRVSEFALGAWVLSGDEAKAMFQAFVEGGGNVDAPTFLVG